ncbi:hypothetical protein CLF_112740 [Clonorchis sinensis]|uniref:Uncharacterized protein n=1 Tax=Clonorchis sinensis TaxID=79923 RepID=G7YMP4_CLOSI|nr:hypothetical protein CLF_112740 [Clonorchis sinensis]
MTENATTVTTLVTVQTHGSFWETRHAYTDKRECPNEHEQVCPSFGLSTTIGAEQPTDHMICTPARLGYHNKMLPRLAVSEIFRTTMTLCRCPRVANIAVIHLHSCFVCSSHTGNNVVSAASEHEFKSWLNKQRQVATNGNYSLRQMAKRWREFYGSPAVQLMTENQLVFRGYASFRFTRASNAQLPTSPPQIIGRQNCGSYNNCTTSTRFLTAHDEIVTGYPGNDH